MKKFLFRQILLFVLLIFLQVWLFNSIHLFGVATPLVYIYFLIKLPVNTNRNMVLLLSALLGFSIDIFEYTWGLNMFAMTITGFLRHFFLKLFAPRDLFDEYIPSFTTFGKQMFIRYAGILTLVHIVILFATESLSLFDPLRLCMRIAGSYILTILLIFALDSLNFESLKK
ncbi:MAG: rod shape-determining protein MreD [Dysgonamonadaceae bacterium]|jgi:rod shape-determining protein MreD|nr:rod shape-determining protein MreD [Dysgonamonadaceae bacterium]